MICWVLLEVLIVHTRRADTLQTTYNNSDAAFSELCVSLSSTIEGFVGHTSVHLRKLAARALVSTSYTSGAPEAPGWQLHATQWLDAVASLDPRVGEKGFVTNA